MFDHLVKGGWLITEENGYRGRRAWIGIEDGRFAAVSEREIPDEYAREVLDAEGCVVMPGLVNGHCHGDMACAMGSGDGLTLDEQNKYFIRFNFLHDFLSDDDRVTARRKSYLDALYGGGTFICENMYWGMGLKSVKALAESGIRGALAEDIRISFLEPEVFIPDEWIEEFISESRKNDLVPILGTVSEEDFDTDLLKRVYAKRDEFGVRNTQHFAETTWREDMVMEKHGLRPVEYLYRNGFLSEKVIGSHCVHVNGREAEMMAKCGVSVINTPLCEMKISDGIAPLTRYVQEGVNVGLGTDGAQWNNSSDMFREMKGAALLQSVVNGPRALSPADVLRMATIGGARAFGVGDRIGSVSERKEADLTIVDMNRPHLQPLREQYRENIASTIVYNATASDVRDVFVKGKLQLRNGIAVHIDTEKILHEAKVLSDRLLKQVTEAEQEEG